MNNLIRQLKLHSLVGSIGAADPRVGQIVTFFEELFDGLQVSVIPDYDEKNLIFHKGVTFYMELDVKNDQLWCCYEGFWEFLRLDLWLDHEETQAIVKMMVEKHLKRQVGIPIELAFGEGEEMEVYLKQQVGKPDIASIYWEVWVGEYLKHEVGTPLLSLIEDTEKVVGHLEKHITCQDS